MTQQLDKQPLTTHFVSMKDAVQDAVRLGLKDYRRLEVIDYKIKVMKSDPLGPADIPAISINRVSDTEVNQALGDVFGEVRDAERDMTVKKFGTDFKETIELRIWTSNSDQRDLLYSLVKAILFNYRHYLALKYGLVNQQIIGGRDEANHIQYEPHAMYWGVIMFQAENAIQRNIFYKTVTEISASASLVTSASLNTDDV